MTSAMCERHHWRALRTQHHATSLLEFNIIWIVCFSFGLNASLDYHVEKTLSLKSFKVYEVHKRLEHISPLWSCTSVSCLILCMLLNVQILVSSIELIFCWTVCNDVRSAAETEIQFFWYVDDTVGSSVRRCCLWLLRPAVTRRHSRSTSALSSAECYSGDQWALSAGRFTQLARRNNKVQHLSAS